jgi:hypothetical protein
MSNTNEKYGYMVTVEERKAGGAYVEIKNRFFVHFRHAHHYLLTCAELFLEDSSQIIITNEVKKELDLGTPLTFADPRTSPYLLTIKTASVYAV